MNSEKEIWSEERKSLFHRIEQLIEEKNSHICRSNSDNPGIKINFGIFQK